MRAFVLAGGRSTRMGRDKALLEVDGRPLIVHALEKLRALGLDPRICGSRPDLEGFGEVIPDRFPESGPLAGIEAGLAGVAAGEDELNLFLAVDLPLLPVEFLRWMIERAEASGAVATIPRAEGREQPLCAVYSRRLQPGLRLALEAGNRKVMRAMSEAAAGMGERLDVFDVERVAAALRTGVWPADPEWKSVPVRTWFRNVNTPEELARLSEDLRGTSAARSA